MARRKGKRSKARRPKKRSARKIKRKARPQKKKKRSAQKKRMPKKKSAPKKAVKRKAVKTGPAPKVTMSRPVLEERAVQEVAIGKVTHYYSHLGVGIIELTDTLRVGDRIHIKGATTDFVQTIESMEIDHRQVEEANAGQVIGIKVREHVRDHDVVYKV